VVRIEVSRQDFPRGGALSELAAAIDRPALALIASDTLARGIAASSCALGRWRWGLPNSGPASMRCWPSLPARSRRHERPPLPQAVRALETVARTGQVTRILPTLIEADGPGAPLGALCVVETGAGEACASVLAEVVGVGAQTITLVPFDAQSTVFGARVTASAQDDRVPVGDGFLGRAVDGLGRPVDGRGPVLAPDYAGLSGSATPPWRAPPPAA